jgi:hypothetical protein
VRLERVEIERPPARFVPSRRMKNRSPPSARNEFTVTR